MDQTFTVSLNIFVEWSDYRIFHLHFDEAGFSNETISTSIFERDGGDIDASSLIPSHLREKINIPDLYMYNMIKFEPLKLIDTIDALHLYRNNVLS